MINKTCGRCVLQEQNGGTCPIFNKQFPEEEQGCPYFTPQLMKCDICGNLIHPKEIVVTNEEPIKILCQTCVSELNTCPTCNFSKQCFFETDPSPIPKVVQREIRKGNIRTVTQVRNPERVDKLCKNKCSCYSSEFGCLRQSNTCNSWKLRD